MNKLTFALSLLIIPFLSFGQEFTLTPDNFRESKNLDKDYFVFEIPGKSQSDLFTKAKTYITGRYKGLKFDGYNEVVPQQIVLDINSTNTIKTIINLTGANVWQVANRYEINFKDGRVMIKPTFKELENTIEINSTAGMHSLFNKKGTPKKEKAIAFIEKETNSFISEFINGMKDNASENW